MIQSTKIEHVAAAAALAVPVFSGAVQAGANLYCFLNAPYVPRDTYVARRTLMAVEDPAAEMQRKIDLHQYAMQARELRAAERTHRRNLFRKSVTP